MNISEIPDMGLLFTKPNEPDAVPDFIVKPGESTLGIPLKPPILTEPDVSSLGKLLSVCTVEKVVAFSSHYDEDTLAGSRKVGAGWFGEVYMVGSQEKNKPVIKVVPIGGDVKEGLYTSDQKK